MEPVIVWTKHGNIQLIGWYNKKIYIDKKNATFQKTYLTVYTNNWCPLSVDFIIAKWTNHIWMVFYMLQLKIHIEKQKRTPYFSACLSLSCPVVNTAILQSTHLANPSRNRNSAMLPACNKYQAVTSMKTFSFSLLQVRVDHTF